jgi:hypothetical protein
MNRINSELIEAAAENNLQEVRRLLGVGTDVNATTTLGSTPLHRASHYGDVQVVQVLVEHGAAIEAEDNAGGRLCTGPATMTAKIQKLPSIYFNDITTPQPVVSLFTSYSKTSLGLAFSTSVVLHHFVLHFIGMCWVRMMSWRWMSIWSSETLHCSALVTKTARYRST